MASVAFERQWGDWVWLLPVAPYCWSCGPDSGAVAGDRRGLVRVGVQRTVKGSQISRFYTTRWARRSRNHSISVGGFAALRHILTIEPLAGESRVSKAVIGRFLPFQNGCYWPVAAFREGQLWVDSGLPTLKGFSMQPAPARPPTPQPGRTANTALTMLLNVAGESTTRAGAFTSPSARVARRA